jgi:hypothetical protein
MLRIVHGMLGVTALSPHNAQPTVSGDRARTSIMSIHLALRGSKEGEHHAHDFKKSVWPLFLDGVTPTKQWHGATPHVGHKSVRKLQSLASFFMHSFISSESTQFDQKCHDTDGEARLYRGTWGLSGLG